MEKHQKDFVPNYFIWVKPGLQEKRAMMMNEMTNQTKYIDFNKFKEENKKYHEQYKEHYIDNYFKDSYKKAS